MAKAKAITVTADDVVPTKVRPQTTTRQRGVVPSDELVPMQFRMPPDFAQSFRMEAVRRNIKYNELLQKCFHHFMNTAK